MRTLGRVLMMASATLGVCIAGWVVFWGRGLSSTAAVAMDVSDWQGTGIVSTPIMLLAILAGCVVVLVLLTLGRWLLWCHDPWGNHVRQAAGRADE